MSHICVPNSKFAFILSCYKFHWAYVPSSSSLALCMSFTICIPKMFCFHIRSPSMYLIHPISKACFASMYWTYYLTYYLFFFLTKFWCHFRRRGIYCKYHKSVSMNVFHVWSIVQFIVVAQLNRFALSNGRMRPRNIQRCVLSLRVGKWIFSWSCPMYFTLPHPCVQL